MKLMTNSTFPGLIMVFFGSVTLSVALLFANYLSPVVNVRDLPVVVQDHNAWRNALGLTAGVTISPAGSNGSSGQTVTPTKAEATSRDLKESKFLLGDPIDPQEKGSSNNPS